jgi:uncharacterized membrane protein
MKPILLTALLLIIFYQDMRHRAVMWVLFPVLFCLSIWYDYKNLQWDNLLFNVAFIVFLLGALTLYVSIRQKKLTAIWQGFFSWGDILFIVAITPLFEIFQYIYFFTFGTLLVLLLHVLFVRYSKNKTVPYAGYLSLITLLFLAFEGQFNHFFLLINGNK